MPRIILLLLALMLALCVAQPVIAAGALHFRVESSFVDSENPCFGEPVAFTGFAQFVVREDIGPNDFHGVGISLQHYVGEGLVTGDRYIVNVANPAVSYYDAEDGVPFVLHNVGQIRGIHTGADRVRFDDYFATVTSHLVVNANGEVVVNKVVFSEGCR